MEEELKEEETPKEQPLDTEPEIGDDEQEI